MKKIILDTNFLLIPYQFKIDIFTEIERICDFPFTLCIIDKTADELMKIIANKEAKGSDKLAAKLAVMLLAAKKIPKISTFARKSVDDLLVEQSAKPNVIIATQDKELKGRLKCPVITMRGKEHLVIEGTG